MPKGKRHDPQLKFKVVLDAAKGDKTLNELAAQYQLHPSQISAWKSQLLKEGASVFRNRVAAAQREQEALQTKLYEQIGRLQMELAWLKKKVANQS